MSVLLSILFWAVCSVLLLLAVLLITPLRFRLYLTNTSQFAYRLDVKAVGGLAPQITLAKGPKTGPKSAQKAKPTKKHRKSGNMRFRGSMVRALPGLIGDILRNVHLSELSFDADYGLNDPAETGQLSGVLMSLQYAHPLPNTVSLTLRPDFTQACLKGAITAGIHFTIAAFIVPALRFGWRAFGPAR